MSARGASDSRYAWRLLALGGITAAVVVAMPTMALPVLFPEMAAELGLTVVQVGAIWGMLSLAGVFTSLIGGSLGDRIGSRRTLIASCMTLGLAGASRGLSGGLATLAFTVFLSGLVASVIPMNLHKMCGVWFSRRRLGVANAVISGGMALGFLMGSMISATVLSPWLGSWRAVLFFYGAISLVMAIPWTLTRDAPAQSVEDGAGDEAPSIRRSLGQVIRLRHVWLLGLSLLAVGGAVQGFLGYLPTYLRGIGWEPARADGAIASFHAVSLAAVVPMAVMSDHLQLRRGFLAVASLVMALGIGVVSCAGGAAVWIGVLLAGVVRDSYMAVFMTTVTEVRGVGAVYAGSALGLAMMLLRLGGWLAPPLGNGMAAFGARYPFVVWAGMGGLGLLALAASRMRRPPPAGGQGRSGGADADR